MKYALIAALTLVSGAAHAAPLFCHTNVENNPREATTSLTINSISEDRASVTEVTKGGMANFETAPRTFDVAMKHIGPENAKYWNAEEGFTLTVTFLNVAGHFPGNLTRGVEGRKLSEPVVCNEAFN